MEPVLLATIFMFTLILSVLLYMYVSTKIVNYLFRHPSIRSPVLVNEKWQRKDIERNGHLIPTYSRSQEGKSHLVILIHGWSSSSQKMVDRANNIFENGYHVMMFDFRGHGAAKAERYFTAETQVEDLKHILFSLDEIFNTKLINSFSLYGHSIGGFISLGYSRHHPTDFPFPYKSLILESPMTSYNLVMQRDSNLVMKAITLLVRKKVRRMWVEKHPNYPIISQSAVEVPEWGVPKCPILLVQAKDDSRLRIEHYELLKPLLPEGSQSHILPELDHSGSHFCAPRERLVVEFLDNNSN